MYQYGSGNMNMKHTKERKQETINWLHIAKWLLECQHKPDWAMLCGSSGPYLCPAEKMDNDQWTGH